MQKKLDTCILEVINQNYPVQVQTVEKVTNEMFRCIGKSGIYYARITNYKSYEEQLEEVSWTNYLFEHGTGVSAAICSFNNRLIVEGMFPEEKLVVLYKAAEGVHLSRSNWHASTIKEIGKMIGRMHLVTKKYERQQNILYLKNWHENEEYQFLKYIPENEKSIRDESQSILKQINELPQSKDTYGLLHGDIWLENVLVSDRSEITLIDFQDCEKHYYLYDLAVPIYSALEFSFSGNANIKDYGKSILHSIIEGYLQENYISDGMIEKMPLFFKLKEIFEYSLMHMYWNKDDLSEEQIRILNLYRLRLENNNNLEFLTNLL